MAALRIFRRFAELLDIKVTRPAKAWLRLNEDGSVSERTASQTVDDLGLGDVSSPVQVIAFGGEALTDGENPVVFPDYLFQFEDRQWSDNGLNSTGGGIYSVGFKNGSQRLEAQVTVDNSLVARWIAREDVATPDLVTHWDAEAPATGSPTFSKAYLFNGSQLDQLIASNPTARRAALGLGSSATHASTDFADYNHGHDYSGVYAPFIQKKKTNFTATVGGRYITDGNITITDPSTYLGQDVEQGDSYEILINSGTATIGWVVYYPSKFSIRRSYNGSAWETPLGYITDAVTFVGGMTLGGAIAFNSTCFFSYQDALTKTAHQIALGGGTTGRAVFEAATSTGFKSAVGVIKKIATTQSARTNTTTYADDEQLSGWTVVANGVYRVKGAIKFNAPSSGGVKVQFTHPASASGSVQYVGSQTAADSSTVGTIAVGNGASLTVINTRSGAQVNGWWTFEFVLEVGAAGGTVNMQWAQNTANNTPSYREPKSVVEIEHLNP